MSAASITSAGVKLSGSGTAARPGMIKRVWLGWRCVAYLDREREAARYGQRMRSNSLLGTPGRKISGSQCPAKRAMQRSHNK